MVTRVTSTRSTQIPTTPVRPAGHLDADTSRHVKDAVQGVLGLSGERMSKVDTAWLRMDSSANLMMILGVWVLKPGVDYEAVCLRITERLVPIHRFRQIAVEDAAGATWVDDQTFDVHRHVVREVLPNQQVAANKGKRAHPVAPMTDEQALQARVAELAIQPLDRSRPLWQFHLVERYDGGSALIARIHHCIADGIALITVMMGMVDGGKAPRTRRKKVADAGDGAHTWLTESLVRPLTQLAVKALDAAGDGVARSVEAVGHPVQGFESTLQSTLAAARMGGQLVSDLAALALMDDDSPTSLKGRPSAKKAVAWCAPIPLAGSWRLWVHCTTAE